MLVHYLTRGSASQADGLYHLDGVIQTGFSGLNKAVDDGGGGPVIFLLHTAPQETAVFRVPKLEVVDVRNFHRLEPAVEEDFHQFYGLPVVFGPALRRVQECSK